MESKKIKLLVDVSSNFPYAWFNNIKDTFSNAEFLCVYFHWNKEHIIDDKHNVDMFERTFNINVNWINISNVYESINNLNEKLNTTVINSGEKIAADLQYHMYVEGLVSQIKNYYIKRLKKLYNCKIINYNIV